jgi:hypothetical protein
MTMQKREVPQYKAIIADFDGPADFARECEARVSESNRKRHDNKRWTGESWAQSMKGAKFGDMSLVKEAEKLLAKIEAGIETPKTEWVASRFGAYPIVPEALAGLPEPMRRMVRATRESAPVRVVIDLTSSAGISSADLLQRGITYLALGMALSQVRPVELSCVIAMNATIGKFTACANHIRLSSTPLDLPTACNALTSCGFTRSLGYAMLHEIGDSTGAWAWNLSPVDDDDRKEYCKRMRGALSLSPDDLFVPPVHIYDKTYKKPLELIKRTIAEYTGREDDGD